jgi:tetratricopeptide (TPR) repeat protein
MAEDKSNKTKWILAGILIICMLAYIPIFNNGFTNWDDLGQLVQNEDVHELSLSNTVKIFSSFYIGMYQPFTTLVYGFIYSIFGENATAFHVFSLMVHLLNVMLVFILIRRFSRNDTVALMTSALFALSPMQVESVAWVSALSNLLFTAFYLLAVISYLRYVRRQKLRYLVYTLIFFSFSLLSKPAAVTLPVVLLFMDLYFRRRLNMRLLLEKAPFFLMAVLIGLIIIFAREEAGHIIDISDRFGLGSRVLMVIYALAYYIANLLVPVGLSAFHPYPVEGLPIAYYIAPFIPIMLIFLVIRLRGEPGRQVTTGLILFFVSIAIVLEIIPVGVQVVKERYVYLPSVGLYYAFATLLIFLLAGRKLSRWLPSAIMALFIVYFSVSTFSRSRTWHDSLSLWDDVLEQYPEASAALINRGNAWQEKEAFDNAINDYTQAIKWEPQAADAYLNRGLVNYKLQKTVQAIHDFDQAILLGIDDAEAYNNRGLLRASQNDFSGALADFDIATQKDPQFVAAWINKGLLYANRSENTMAINALNEAIRIDPGSARAYYWRGMMHLGLYRTDIACQDLKIAASLGWPQEQIPEVCR